MTVRNVVTPKWSTIQFATLLSTVTGILLCAQIAIADVSLTWTPGDNTPILGYIIQRKSGIGAYVEIARPTLPPYTDTAVPPTPPVCYVARAYNQAFTSGPSNEVCLTTPGAPGSLTITLTIGVNP